MFYLDRIRENHYGGIPLKQANVGALPITVLAIPKVFSYSLPRIFVNIALISFIRNGLDR